MTVFWIAIYTTIVLVVAGGIYNFYRERKRRRLFELQ
jgi:hypothetical protein